MKSRIVMTATTTATATEADKPLQGNVGPFQPFPFLLDIDAVRLFDVEDFRNRRLTNCATK